MTAGRVTLGRSCHFEFGSRHHRLLRDPLTHGTGKASQRQIQLECKAWGRGKKETHRLANRQPRKQGRRCKYHGDFKIGCTNPYRAWELHGLLAVVVCQQETAGCSGWGSITFRSQQNRHLATLTIHYWGDLVIVMQLLPDIVVAVRLRTLT